MTKSATSRSIQLFLFDYVALLEVFSEEEEEDKDDLYVAMDL